MDRFQPILIMILKNAVQNLKFEPHFCYRNVEKMFIYCTSKNKNSLGLIRENIFRLNLLYENA